MKRLGSVVFGRSRPLQRRLTVLTMMAVALTVAATCLTGWLALRVTLFDVNERGSLLIARDLAALATDEIGANGRLSARLLGPGSTVVEAVASDGTVLLVPGEDTALTVGQQEVAAAQQQQTTVRNTTNSNGDPYRVVTLPLGESYALVVGRPLSSTHEILRVFGLVVLVVGSVGILWAWVLGRTIAKTALNPVRRFTDAVQHVAETEDLDPVPTDLGGGDLATLTGTFNHMLRRLALSRDQQKRLIADAGHELRTPLTSPRTNIELLALDSRSKRLDDSDRADILSEALAQTVELSALVSDLVHLAREKVSTTDQLLDLGSVVRNLVEQAQRSNPGLSFDIDLGQLSLVGDASSLERAVANVLDNAAKWSRPGGTVSVRLHGCELSIVDDGVGIDEADLPHIFDRFYRAEAARSTPGTGLGLSIAAEAVQDHGGTITAGRSAAGGARVVIRFPDAAGVTTIAAPGSTRSRPLADAVTSA